MSRVINPDSVGKARNQHMRTAAEIMRHLSQKTDLDDETRDMVATLVLCFREIEDGIEQSMEAWEKRNYWQKVEEFRRQWTWVGIANAELEHIVRTGAWDQLPQQMVKLMPRFAEIQVTRFTREKQAWQGAYQKVLSETKA